jgi:hypothetical protein
MTDYDHVWTWATPLPGGGPGRKGQRCRVIEVGRWNSALVEFPDGYRAAVNRDGLCQDPPGDDPHP